MTTASKVAEYLLLKSQESGKTITNKKLQKLLYYCQAWTYTLKKKALFSDAIEAWIHGPAIRSIYMEYKFFGFNGIRVRRKLDASKIKSNFDQGTLEVLESVWKVYGKYDSAYLENLTHSEDPWIQAREGLDTDEGSNREISVESMGKFYSKKLESSKKTSVA